MPRDTIVQILVYRCQLRQCVMSRGAGQGAALNFALKLRDAIGFTAEASVRNCLEEVLGRYEFYSAASLKMPPEAGLLQLD